MKRGAPPKKLLDMRLGLTQTPEEEAADRQERAYAQQSAATALSNWPPGVPIPPDLLRPFAEPGAPPPLSSRGHLARLAEESSTRDEFVERAAVEMPNATESQINSIADERFGKPKGLKKRMEDFGERLEQSESFKRNWPLTDVITKTWSDAVNSLLPGPPSLAGHTEENLRELAEMASGDGPRAAKARELLEQYERMVKRGAIKRPGWKTSLAG
jgi:hypothetical protein